MMKSIPLRIYNSATKQLEDFVPEDPFDVRMYVCGPTVYAEPHIGNMRPAVHFDSVFRVLRELYGANAVRYVSNFTDIDDKIIDKANKAGVSIDEITRLATFQYQEAIMHLNVLEPTYRPFATQYVEEMIDMIDRLVQKGHAYVTGDGDVAFAVESNPNAGYFQPDRDPLDVLFEDARTDAKRDPRDFVLWKQQKPGEPAWESPWGPGRPGWHIECSAMIAGTLGETIDIHGGGLDLQFPHHEAECAQSFCAHGKMLSKYWMHSEMINLDSYKMAKSRGNVLYIRDWLKQVPGEVIRYRFLSTHYRKPLAVKRSSTFKPEKLTEQHQQVDSFYRTLYKYRNVERDYSVWHDEKFIEAVYDDFNFPGAITRFIELHSEIQGEIVYGSDTHRKLSQFLKAADLLGILQIDPVVWFHYGVNSEEIERLISERTAARKEKDWDRSDKIRADLMQLGVTLEDTSDGTFWYTNAGYVRKD